MDVNRLGNGAYSAPAPPPPSQSSSVGVEVQQVAQAVSSYQAIAPEAPADQRPQRGEVDTLSRAVREVNSVIDVYSRHLDVRFHEPTGRRMVTVYDSRTNEPIREIPPESVLDAHAHVLELAGIFMDTRG